MYLKAYYRRAAAHMSLGKYKLALRDYERVYKARPNDKDSKKKLANEDYAGTDLYLKAIEMCTRAVELSGQDK